MKNLDVIVMSLEDLATREQVFAVVDRIGAEYRAAEESAEKLRYMLGKSMAFVQDTWSDEGAAGGKTPQSFEQWTLDLGERLGLSRATLRKALGVYRALPGLSLDKVAKIPMTNLELVAQISRGDVSAHKVAGLLRRAEGPLATFRAGLEEEGLLGSKDASIVSVVVKVKRRVAQQWKRLVSGEEASKVFASMVEQALHSGHQRRAA